MARRVRRDGDGAALRAFLLEQSRELVRGMLDGPGWHRGKPIVPPPPPVDIDRVLADGEVGATMFAGLWSYRGLRDGGAATVHRWDLPDWCPERWAGLLHDRLVLTEGNELVPA